MRVNQLAKSLGVAPDTVRFYTGISEFVDYQRDVWERSILFWDTLRQRANNMLDHERAGLPPLLNFTYDTLLDARSFERPANYALLRINSAGEECLEDCVDKTKPPVMIIDPRAGHGPGIGGFKRDSEVGMALHEGHPVYFVIFYPKPCPNQTLADVLHALRRFVEHIGSLHDGRAPILYGNCQAGWAAVLLAADCEGLAGPVVLNGSPLSYWAGESGVNPMRLGAGFTGGAWLTHLLADLGNGQFDGAWLAQNFENLKPENSYWEKYTNLFTNIDSERDRFLDFERWWNGFYFLSREEILAIVENLFIGNKLEKGQMQICPNCYIDLKRIRNPLVVFASYGDNITPPHQALGWIPKVYESTDALKAAEQRIVYLTNPHVGHLGIFVSAKIARFEHRAILENLGEIEALAPGLYEMIIDNPTGDPDCHRSQYKVHYEERRVEDLPFDQDDRAFERVRKLSEINERLYSRLVSPWIRAVANPWSANALKWLHPARTSRYLWSERLNPAMTGVALLASLVQKNRHALEGNSYLERERQVAQDIAKAIKEAREQRDLRSERDFQSLYASTGVGGDG